MKEKIINGFKSPGCSVLQPWRSARCQFRKSVPMCDDNKKQLPIHLSRKLYDALAKCAEDDFRSINGRIEYLLTECVKQ